MFGDLQKIANQQKWEKHEFFMHRTCIFCFRSAYFFAQENRNFTKINAGIFSFEAWQEPKNVVFLIKMPVRVWPATLLSRLDSGCNKTTKILYINCLHSYFNKISRVKTTLKRNKNTVMSRGSCLLTYFNTHYIIIL